MSVLGPDRSVDGCKIEQHPHTDDVRPPSGDSAKSFGFPIFTKYRARSLKPTSTAQVLHQLADTIQKRALIVIFTDMFSNGDTEELFSALQHLCYNKHEVILFHVKDKRMEEAFEFSNRPHLFIDLESGREIKFSPNEIRETYKQKMAEFYQELKLRCGQLRIDFVEADIDREFHEVLFPYLLKRSKLY